MKKYAVAFISFHDNILKLHAVCAESARGAQEMIIKQECFIDPEDGDLDFNQKFAEALAEAEDLKQFCFDMDAMISDAMELIEFKEPY